MGDMKGLLSYKRKKKIGAATCSNMAFNRSLQVAILTLFVVITVTEIKCQGLRYDRPSPEKYQ